MMHIDVPALVRKFVADDSSGTHLPPLDLPLMAWDDLPELDRTRAMTRLRADQARRDADARRQGRDPLAEAVAAHLAACARTGLPPLVAARG